MEAALKIAREMERAYPEQARQADSPEWRERFVCYANVAATIAEQIEDCGGLSHEPTASNRLGFAPAPPHAQTYHPQPARAR